MAKTKEETTATKSTTKAKAVKAAPKRAAAAPKKAAKPAAKKPAKKSLVALVENLGRAMGRVSTTSADSKAEQPPVELIGAVLMMHEIIDGIKKIAR